jgi:hypothetical protein
MMKAFMLTMLLFLNKLHLTLPMARPIPAPRCGHGAPGGGSVWWGRASNPAQHKRPLLSQRFVQFSMSRQPLHRLMVRPISPLNRKKIISSYNLQMTSDHQSLAIVNQHIKKAL